MTVIEAVVNTYLLHNAFDVYSTLLQASKQVKVILLSVVVIDVIIFITNPAVIVLNFIRKCMLSVAVEAVVNKICVTHRTLDGYSIWMAYPAATIVSSHTLYSKVFVIYCYC